MEKINRCILCFSEDIANYIRCKDNLVSKEYFVLSKCNNCGFVFTNPRPDAISIRPYYKAETYYSHNINTKTFTSYIYNFIRKINVKGKVKLIDKIANKKGKLLDYGCGAGLFIKEATQSGWTALGIEPNEDARKVAKNLGVNVIPPEMLEKLDHEHFDIISLWHVLEHIHELEKVLEKLVSLLAENGKLIIAVPNIDSWDAKKYMENWAAYDVPRHLYHFNPSTIELLFSKFGMAIVNKYPMKFDSYYVSLLSEGHTWKAYFKAFINGLRSNMNARSTGNYSSLIYIIQK